MKHLASAAGISAADIERAMDRLAREIAARKQDGRRLLPLYSRLESELAKLKAEEDTLSRVMARLSHITR